MVDEREDLTDALREALVEGFLVQADLGWAGRNHWAYTVLVDLLMEAPGLGWPILREMVRRAPDEALAYLGAGPLEDLLVLHGAECIASIEREAHAYPRLRLALAGVWRNAIPEPVWERVQALLGEEDRAALEMIDEAAELRWIEAWIDGRPPTRPGDAAPEQRARREALLAAVTVTVAPGFAPWSTPVGVEVRIEWPPYGGHEAAAIDVLAAIVETLAADRDARLVGPAMADLAVVTERRLVRQAEIVEARGASPRFHVSIQRMPEGQVAALDDPRTYDEIAEEALRGLGEEM